VISPVRGHNECGARGFDRLPASSEIAHTSTVDGKAQAFHGNVGVLARSSRLESFLTSLGGDTPRIRFSSHLHQCHPAANLFDLDAGRDGQIVVGEAYELTRALGELYPCSFRERRLRRR